MSDITANLQAYLDRLPRVQSVEEGRMHHGDVLLLPECIRLRALADSNVKTIGMGKTYDDKPRDMLRVIEAYDGDCPGYVETNVLSPLLYVHTLKTKPWHVTTQALLVTWIGEQTRQAIAYERDSLHSYGKHPMDCFWLPCSKPLEEIDTSDAVCLFNRRISGWDGSMDCPVIELLGAGGHLQSIWDEETGRFVSRTWSDNLKKEFVEEIGLSIGDSDIHHIGAFVNSETQEVVVFFCIFIPEDKILDIQAFALDNISEDTNGIYLGTMRETLDYYQCHPDYFAGGANALKSNFTANERIMRNLWAFARRGVKT